MSFVGTVVKHERLILVKYDDRSLIVDARASEDQNIYLGGPAYLDVAVVRGLPVEEATFNVNSWDVYREEDPEALAILLDHYFKSKEEA